MEFITMVYLINIGAILFIVLTMYQGYKFKGIMTDSAYHHLLSHASLVGWLTISLDVFLFYGYISPLMFAFLYVLQHVSKENSRLIETNQWTSGIKDV